MSWLRRIALGAALSLALPAAAQSASGTVAAADWDAYRAHFLDVSGRIVDDGNGGISHSEGQGYGLLLSYLADDAASFDQIWSFTRAELMIRDDGLAAWRWEPDATPHVTDVNNATDGDILIAYALALAGAAWGRQDFTDAATALATALWPAAIRQQSGVSLLMPAAQGFDAADREDGPVVNPSYWVFEAFPVLEDLVPDADWAGVIRSGTALLGAARFGPAGLPSEWVSLAGSAPQPAAGFQPDFGYNAIRIPLYLVRAGMTGDGLLDPYSRNWSADGSNVAVISLPTGDAAEAFSDPGYRAVAALVACAADGTAFPDDLRRFEPTMYYPSTLHLLALAAVAEREGGCR
jgi:endoglucanase